MNIIMKNVQAHTVEDMQQFLSGNKSIDCVLASRKEKYACIATSLIMTKYATLVRSEKSIVKLFLAKVTGYETRQLKRLIREWKQTGLRYQKRKATGALERIYTAADVALLIKTDILHQTPNGLSTKAILKREASMFSHEAYHTIANISVSHLYNIRKKNQQYRSSEAIKY